MISDVELTRAVRMWLDEGVTELPEGVLDAVLERIPVTPQNGRPLVDIRPRLVDIRPRIAGARPRAFGQGSRILAVAAVVVLAFVGTVGLLGSSGIGATGSAALPSAGPSASPATAPSQLGRRPVPPNGAIEGDYVYPLVDGLGKDVFFTAPAGWRACCDGYWIHKKVSYPPDGVGFALSRPTDVFADPCEHVAEPSPLVGPTVDDLVAAIQAQPGRRPSAPRPTTLAGYDGVEIEWSVPSDAVVQDCRQGSYESWYEGSVTNVRYHQGPGQIDHLWILDVDGVRLVVMTTYYAATSLPDRAELDAIVASIEFVPRQAGSPSPSGGASSAPPASPTLPARLAGSAESAP
jgi:hypothetical protein